MIHSQPNVWMTCGSPWSPEETCKAPNRTQVSPPLQSICRNELRHLWTRRSMLAVIKVKLTSDGNVFTSVNIIQQLLLSVMHFSFLQSEALLAHNRPKRCMCKSQGCCNPGNVRENLEDGLQNILGKQVHTVCFSRVCAVSTTGP